ncbi:RNA-binding protein [Bradyrhizobium sp. 482_C4_N1_1]|uniref:RNA-binding protein n=1 Tax=unclassified Bradyrhizobium TaxID=2631580 RepID=UPI00339927ED
MSIRDQRALARLGSQSVSRPERAGTDAQQAARQGDVVNQVETTEELSDVPDSESSLFGLCVLGLAGIATLGWICTLAWIAWRLAAWVLS